MTSFPLNTETLSTKLTSQDCVICRSSAAQDKRLGLIQTICRGSELSAFMRHSSEFIMSITKWLTHLIYHLNITANVSFMTAVLSRLQVGSVSEIKSKPADLCFSAVQRNVIKKPDER